jgi:hypothetical protein
MKNRNLPHSDNWATPLYVYDELNERFHFDFDPCPIEHDVSKWNGLEVEWGTSNFVNPPYSVDLKKKFVLKAVEEKNKGKLCVLLLPVSTSTRLFHDVILQNITEPIRFWKGRIKFKGYDSWGNFVTNKSPMHDSMIVVFDGRNKNI